MIETIAAPAMIFVIVSSVFASIAVHHRIPRRRARPGVSHSLLCKACFVAARRAAGRQPLCSFFL